MSTMSRLLVGAVAGTVATVSMSATMGAAKGAKLLGEPPPRKITRAAVPELARHPLALDAATWATHFGFGASMGALYSLALGARRPSLASGVLLGSAVWAVSYMGWVPAMGIMRPPSEDRPGRPASMLTAHWVFGSTLAQVLRMLPR